MKCLQPSMSSLVSDLTCRSTAFSCCRLRDRHRGHHVQLMLNNCRYPKPLVQMTESTVDGVNCYPKDGVRGHDFVFWRFNLRILGARFFPPLFASEEDKYEKNAWHAFDTPGKISPNIGDDKQPSLILTSRSYFLLLPHLLRKLSSSVESTTLVFVCSSFNPGCKQDRLLINQII
jgi:hypothetical protein